MFITGLSTAAPPRRYGQRDCWEALQVAEPFSLLRSRSKVILKKVLLGDNGIDTRHLALDPLTEAFDLNPEALHARFVRHAPALATQAATGRPLNTAGRGGFTYLPQTTDWLGRWRLSSDRSCSDECFDSIHHGSPLRRLLDPVKSERGPTLRLTSRRPARFS